MSFVNMSRDLFLLKMNRAKIEVLTKYMKHDIPRNDYFEQMDQINKALLNDKLGLIIYKD